MWPRANPNWEILSISTIYKGWYERRYITRKVFQNAKQVAMMIARLELRRRSQSCNCFCCSNRRRLAPGTYRRMELHLLQDVGEISHLTNIYTYMYIYGMPINDISYILVGVLINLGRLDRQNERPNRILTREWVWVLVLYRGRIQNAHVSVLLFLKMDSFVSSPFCLWRIIFWSLICWDRNLLYDILLSIHLPLVVIMPCHDFVSFLRSDSVISRMRVTTCDTLLCFLEISASKVIHQTRINKEASINIIVARCAIRPEYFWNKNKNCSM